MFPYSSNIYNNNPSPYIINNNNSNHHHLNTRPESNFSMTSTSSRDDHENPIHSFQHDYDDGVLLSRLLSQQQLFSQLEEASLEEEVSNHMEEAVDDKRGDSWSNSKGLLLMKEEEEKSIKTSVGRKRSSGKKDRHSKICTAQGPRDRRMRLSLQIARKFFDLQDMLGFDKASKTIEWLFHKSKSAIKELKDNVSSSSSPNLKTRETCHEMAPSSSSIDEITEKRERKSRKMSIVGKESREKARERARERTRQKMKMVGGSTNNDQELINSMCGGEDQEQPQQGFDGILGRSSMISDFLQEIAGTTSGANSEEDFLGNFPPGNWETTTSTTTRSGVISNNSNKTQSFCCTITNSKRYTTAAGNVDVQVQNPSPCCCPNFSTSHSHFQDEAKPIANFSIFSNPSSVFMNQSDHFHSQDAHNPSFNNTPIFLTSVINAQDQQNLSSNIFWHSQFL